MISHYEKPGHCPACAAEHEQLAGRVQRLEQLLEDLDGTLAKYIRATPATPILEAPPTDTTDPHAICRFSGVPCSSACPGGRP